MVLHRLSIYSVLNENKQCTDYDSIFVGNFVLLRQRKKIEHYLMLQDKTVSLVFNKKGNIAATNRL